MKKSLIIKLSVIFLFAILATIFSFSENTSSKAYATATGFSAGRIIDDNVFTNSSALNVSQIQTFLNDMVGSCYAPNAKSTNPGNGSCINQYVENTSTLQNNFSNPNASIAGGISAAQIIYNAAQQYSINPEVLLVTLQKEQGLVTDNWPFYSEYQAAMGYACPDSSPHCNGTYSDFYKQVAGAAWQFRNYLNSPGAYNYWIGSNTISYAPGCGGSTVNIQNAATAALYIYTPYQPDSNVLNSTNPISSNSGPGPAINDSCATYGNRNFWWYFNTWFGSSVDTSVSLAVESGSSTFYVLYDGQKQGIPSMDVLNSWGLEGLPVATLDPSVFNAIPTASTALTRYALDTQNGSSYFADNGNVYWATANDVSDWGSFPGQSESQISSTLVRFADNQGELKPYVSVSGNSTYYVMDNGSLHPVTSGAAYNLWAGQGNPPIQLSSAYFGGLTTLSSLVSYPEFVVGSTKYVLSDGNIFSLNSNTTNLVPSGWGGGITIGSALANTFSNQGALQYKVQAMGTPAVYLLDTNGALRAIPDLATDSAYQTDPSGDTSQISSDLMSALTPGSALTSNIVSISGSYYVVNGGLQPIPTGLDSAYNVTSTATTLNSAYSSIFPTIGSANEFVKTPDSVAIYFIDSGNLLPFSNPVTFSLVSNNVPATILTDATLNEFGNGAIMQDYVSNGGTNYLIDSGTTHIVASAGMAGAWNLGSPLAISAAAISSFPSGAALSQYVQIPNGQYCLIDSKAYCANQSALINMWQLSSATLRPSQTLLNSLNLNNTSITPFASAEPGQPHYGTIYTITGSHQLIGIPSMNAAINLGINRWPIMNLDSYTLNNLLSNQVWQGYLANDDSGNTWVLDGGSKHAIPSSYLAAWVGNNTPTVLGSDYLSLIPTANPISNAINSPPNPTVYGLKNGDVYGFTSPQSYNSSGVAGSTTVNNSLLQLIPSGGIWTSP